MAYTVKELLNQRDNSLKLTLELREKSLIRPVSLVDNLLETYDQMEISLTNLLIDSEPILVPLTSDISTLGQLINALLNINSYHLMNPMHISYIHCLHRITLMGILPQKHLGTFRKIPVNIGREDVYFPPASFIHGLMDEYCKQFPFVLREVTKYDGILKSAEASYKFVAIHPYKDGNGRISRLLMNIVLWGKGHPPVYLKANKTSRHRYAQALKRANHGNIEPLACLIALSLKEIYEKLLATIPEMAQTIPPP